MIPKILTIAGSDSCSGAGIQADLKTAAAHKTYCATAITSLTAQNTQGVTAINNPDEKFLQTQLETLFTDIKFNAIKIGMLATTQIINIVNQFLKNYPNIPIILDPVMVATSGDKLLEDNAIQTLKSTLIPKSCILTPNIDEAEILASQKIQTPKQMKQAAKSIQSLGCPNILIKAGHLKTKTIQNLLLDSSGNFHQITNQRIQTKPLHGTGCTLATAITCNIANGDDTISAIKKANRYVYQSIKRSLQIGKGSNVLKHHRN